ncbi:Protein-glutamate methylesterase/protein-glutamine glutaminase 2 [Gammaproteobacteria bacterium]
MKPTGKVRVLMVEDSEVIRILLSHLIECDPRLELVGTAVSGEQAIPLLHHLAPDVISMDIRLPGMNGFETTRRIMSERPTPIVVIASAFEDDTLDLSMNALRAGALSVVEKPVGTRHADYERMADQICTQLYIMSQVKVVRQRFGRDEMTSSRSQPRAVNQFTEFTESMPPLAPEVKSSDRILGVVASTGGPNALVKVLGALPSNFPLPVCVVQHIGADFVTGFSSWLDGLVPLPVSIARHGEFPLPGHIYVAGANVHLRVGMDGLLSLHHDRPVSAQRPSGTILFESMAASLGSRGIGVLLTGMGDDGARGLLAMRKAGGYTIAEDASTAVVYGMPAAAVQLDAVTTLLPLDAITPKLLQILNINK